MSSKQKRKALKKLAMERKKDFSNVLKQLNPEENPDYVWKQ